MSKFGKKNLLKFGRAKRASQAQMEVLITWAADPSKGRFERRNTIPVSATTRVSTRTIHYPQTNETIEYAVVVDRFVEGEWAEVLCIDTCNHGTVHRHRNNDHRNPPDVIATITSQEVIQNSYWDAVEEAYTEAERE